MNCVNCYQEIPDDSKFCPHCGAKQPDNPGADYGNTQSDSSAFQSGYQAPPVYQSSYEPEKPINWVPYLVLSIITTLCCCLPFGIVGIVYSAKINNAVNSRDWEAARKAANTAKIWIIVSAVVGVIVEIIYIALIFSGVVGSGYYYY